MVKLDISLCLYLNLYLYLVAHAAQPGRFSGG
jgi:hypothetical protein